REGKKKPLDGAVGLGLIGGNGQDIALTLGSGKRVENGVIELTKRTETFRFKDVPSRPVPSLLRAFSAPVNLTLGLSDADLEFLMANDSDLYNRWQAAQDYANRVLIEAVKALRAGGRPAKPNAFVAALRATLPDEGCEPGYRAEFMFWRSESELARGMGRDVDPLAIHNARKGLRKAIGTALHDRLLEAYRRYEVKGAYSPAPEPAGRRA